MTTVFEFLKTQNPLNLLAEKFKKVVSRAKRSTLPSFIKDPEVIMTQIDQNQWKNKLIQSIGGYKHPVIVNGQ